MQTKTEPSTRVRRVRQQKKDHNEGDHVKSEKSTRASLNTFPRRISETTTSEHTVAVTTQEALDGYRALDMTNCDFSVRSARDE